MWYHLIWNLKGGVPWPASIQMTAHLALEKGMMMKKLLFGTLFASMAFGTNIALADGWPVSVLGRWSVIANFVSGTLSITSQGAGDCQPIAGTIFGNPIKGFYCPRSGRIHFLRNNSNGITIQDYTANLSQNVVPLHMGGTFASDLGAFGEYNFSGAK